VTPPTTGQLQGRTYPTYLAAAVLGLLLSSFASNARGPVFPDILASLAISDGAGGLMFSATCAGSLTGSMFFQRLMRRWSSMRSMQLGLFVAWAGLMGVSDAWNLASLLGASFVFGIGSGGLSLAQNLMIDEASSGPGRRRWYAVLHSVYGLASLGSPIAVVALGSADGAWRGSMQLLAIPVLVLALGLLAATPLPRRDPGKHGASASSPLGRRAWVLALMAGCAVCAELVISTRLVLLCRRLGYDEASAAAHLTGFFVALLSSRLLLGVLKTTIANRRLVAFSLAGAGIAAALGLLVDPLFLAVVAFPLGPFFPATMDMISEEFGEKTPRVVANMIVVVSLMLATTHALVGGLSDVVGLKDALWVCPILLCLGLPLLWWSGRRR